MDLRDVPGSTKDSDHDGTQQRRSALSRRSSHRASFTSATHVVDEEQIKAFARQFDPQPFHLDNEAAKDTLFSGLAASGWHTAAITMRLLVEGGLPIAGGIVGVGGELTRACSDNQYSFFAHRLNSHKDMGTTSLEIVEDRSEACDKIKEHDVRNLLDPRKGENRLPLPFAYFSRRGLTLIYLVSDRPGERDENLPFFRS